MQRSERRHRGGDQLSLAGSGQLVWAAGCELSLVLVHARRPAWPGETSETILRVAPPRKTRPPDPTRVNWPMDASASGSAQVGPGGRHRWAERVQVGQEPARQKAREGYPSHYISLMPPKCGNWNYLLDTLINRILVRCFTGLKFINCTYKYRHRFAFTILYYAPQWVQGFSSPVEVSHMRHNVAIGTMYKKINCTIFGSIFCMVTIYELNSNINSVNIHIVLFDAAKWVQVFSSPIKVVHVPSKRGNWKHLLNMLIWHIFFQYFACI